MQSVSYSLHNNIEIDFKFPIYNIFQTPHGFSKLRSSGNLVLEQKDSFALGAAHRQINFDMFHFAENMLFNDYHSLHELINKQNTTLTYVTSTKNVSPPIMED